MFSASSPTASAAIDRPAPSVNRRRQDRAGQLRQLRQHACSELAERFEDVCDRRAKILHGVAGTGPSFAAASNAASPTSDSTDARPSGQLVGEIRRGPQQTGPGPVANATACFRRPISASRPASDRARVRRGSR